MGLAANRRVLAYTQRQYCGGCDEPLLTAFPLFGNRSRLWAMIRTRSGRFFQPEQSSVRRVEANRCSASSLIVGCVKDIHFHSAHSEQIKNNQLIKVACRHWLGHPHARTSSRAHALTIPSHLSCVALLQHASRNVTNRTRIRRAYMGNLFVQYK